MQVGVSAVISGISCLAGKSAEAGSHQVALSTTPTQSPRQEAFCFPRIRWFLTGRPGLSRVLHSGDSEHVSQLAAVGQPARDLRPALANRERGAGGFSSPPYGRCATRYRRAR